MKKVKGYWTDENKNSWDADIYTEEEALEASSTMAGCRKCLNCISCMNCISCRNCRACLNCRHSQHCLSCRDSRKCVSCRNCISCRNCRACLNIEHCRGYRYGRPGLDSRICFFPKNKQKLSFKIKY